MGKGGVTIQQTSQVPHIPQLWQLVHVLDRASVLSFLYSHTAQLSEFYIEYRYNEEGPTMPIVVESALGTATDDYDPSEYCGFTGKNSQGEGDSGLLQLRKAFPGAMKVLDICFLWQTQVRSFSSGGYLLVDVAMKLCGSEPKLSRCSRSLRDDRLLCSPLTTKLPVSESSRKALLC